MARAESNADLKAVVVKVAPEMLLKPLPWAAIAVVTNMLGTDAHSRPLVEAWIRLIEVILLPDFTTSSWMVPYL